MAYLRILSEEREARIDEIHTALLQQGYLALPNRPNATLLAEKIADLQGLVGVEIDLEEAVLIVHTDTAFCPSALACESRLIPESETRTRTEVWWAPRDMPECSSQKGKQYLRLYHGRRDPKETLDDWGSAGPLFGPYESIQVTYTSHIKMHAATGVDELNWHEDLIYYDGVYYGDLEIFSSGEALESESYQREKAIEQEKEKNDESKPAL